MKHLKKLEWLPDALSDGSIVTSDGPYTISPEQAIQFADYRFNKQQSMMPYNTVIALDRGENCSDRNDGNTSFTKTFLSKIGTAPVLIRSELLPPNTPTGDTEFDKTYPFWCLAVTIVSSEMDLTNTYLCLEACNTGHTHQVHSWGHDERPFYHFPLEAKKYLSGGIVKYKTIPDSKSFSFITTKISEKRSNIKLSVEGITQIKNPKVGKTYYLYIALPYNYLRYKQYLYDKLQIEDEDWNTYIKFRPCIKYKRENIRDLNIYTLPLSFPYELNCRYPEIFYSAWSTNTTTLPPPSIETAINRIDADYLGTTSQFSYSIGWPIENGTVTVTSSSSWITINSHSSENKTVSFTISENTTTGNRNGYIDLSYSNVTSTRIYIYQAGKPSISIDKNSVDFTSIGGEATVTCQTSNGAGDITTSSSYSWITTSISGNIVTISVSENTSTSTRSGSVNISYSNITQTISIGQYGKPVVTLGSTSVSFSSSGGTKTVSCTISGFGNVTISYYALWLSASYNSSNSTIVITANENNNTLTNRSADITVRCGNSDIKTINVTQDKKVVSYSYTVSYLVNNTFGSSLSWLSVNLYDSSGKSMNMAQTSLSGTFTFSSRESSLSLYLRASGRTTSNKVVSGSSSTRRIYPDTTASFSCNLYLENTGGDSGEITFPGGRPTVTVDPGVLGPRSVSDPSGDSNSLEDILTDYETDQI